MSLSFGWVRDDLDHRDQTLTLGAPISVFPNQVSLRGKIISIYDQGQLGSCTANAAAQAYRVALKSQGKPDYLPSRLGIYYDERVLEHSANSDSGAQIRDSVKVLNKTGAGAEADWSYDIAQFAIRPSKAYYQNAIHHEALSYQSVPQVERAMKAALIAGFPIIIGFTCFPGLETDATLRSGHIPMPGAGEKPIGGHAVLVVGYDDTTFPKVYTIANSWGTQVGDQGYFTIPQEYLHNPKLAGDYWILRIVA